ncbi:hypothetical protein [Legionella adelaidensis]|nr:hypothetical protein [Legionella adelaidensis]
MGPSYWTYLIPFIATAFVGKLWHRHPRDVLRFLSLLSRNFQQMWSMAPPLITVIRTGYRIVGISTNPGPAMFANFGGSLGLSFIKYLASKRRSRANPIESNENSKTAKIKMIFFKIKEKGGATFREFVLPAASFAGKWGYFRLLTYTFLVSFFQQLGWMALSNNHLPEVYEKWLLLFTLLPAAYHLTLSLANKFSPQRRKDTIEKLIIYSNGITDGILSFSILTGLFASVLISYQDQFGLPFQLFICMGGAAPVGIFMGIFSTKKGFYRRETAWLKGYEFASWDSSTTEFLSNVIYVKFEVEEGNVLKYAVVDPLGDLRQGYIEAHELNDDTASYPLTLEELESMRTQILLVTSARTHTRPRVKIEEITEEGSVELLPVSSTTKIVSQLGGLKEGTEENKRGLLSNENKEFATRPLLSRTSSRASILAAVEGAGVGGDYEDTDIAYQLMRS